MGKKKVMVVDDDPEFVEMLHDVLAFEGLDVVAYLDPKEAVAKAPQWLPEVVITDLKMPTLNGFDLAKTLRENPSTKDVNIIVCTAYPLTENRWAELARLGCEILTKPFEFDNLLHMLDA